MCDARQIFRRNGAWRRCGKNYRVVLIESHPILIAGRIQDRLRKSPCSALLLRSDHGQPAQANDKDGSDRCHMVRGHYPASKRTSARSSMKCFKSDAAWITPFLKPLGETLVVRFLAALEYRKTIVMRRSSSAVNSPHRQISRTSSCLPIDCDADRLWADNCGARTSPGRSRAAEMPSVPHTPAADGDHRRLVSGFRGKR